MSTHRTLAATLRHAAWPLLVFEAALEAATFLALDPLLVLLLDRVVALGGDPFVGNTALVAFLLSPAGLVALPVAALSAVFATVLAWGGASLILWHATMGRQPGHLATWRTLLAHTHRLLAFAAYACAAALLLSLPVLAAALGARHLWLSGGDFYFYLTTRPPAFIRAVALVGGTGLAAGIAALVLLLRTALAVPIALLCPVGVHRALRLSLRATRGRAWALLPKLLAAALGTILLGLAVAAALSALVSSLLARDAGAAVLHGAGIAVVVLAAIAFAALAALSRALFLLVLLHDRAAAAALPRAPAPPPVRRAGLRWHLAGLAASCGVVPIAAALGIAAPSQALPHAVFITAHRAGSARAPENTLAALKAAIADGADVVEVDAQETADGEIVLLHDTDLRRVAGVSRPVWQMSADELERLDAGSWFSPRFADERIPTLRAFALAARGHVRLNVEIKNNGHGQDLAARTAAILRETGTADTSAISSLDMGLLRQVRRVAPRIKLGLILATGVGNLNRVDVDFVALSQRLATRAVIRQLAAHGREVHVWTLDDDAGMARAMLNGADNLITGDTRRGVRMRAWFEDLNEPQRILLRVGYSLSAGWMRLIGAGGWSGAPASDQADPAEP